MAGKPNLGAYWKNNVLNFYDKINGATFKDGPWAHCPILAILADPSLGTIFLDDFFMFGATGDLWTIVEDAGAGGTDGVQDAAGGWYKHFCDGDDNDEAYLATEGESWKLETNKPLWFEAKIKLTEANTDDANWIVGLIEGGGAANTLQDDGAGPLANYDGACFFKVDGTMKVQFETSIAAAQVTNATLADFTSGTAVRLGFHWDGVGTVTPYVDGVAGTAHTMAATGGELNACFGVKAGGGNEEAIEIDYIKVVQLR